MDQMYAFIQYFDSRILLFIIIVFLLTKAISYCLNLNSCLILMRKHLDVPFLFSGISVDRFMAVYAPYKYQQMVTVTKTIFVISILWVYSFSMSYLPPLLGYHHWIPNAKCYLANIITAQHLPILVGNFFVITLVIYVMYAAMFKIAASHMRKIAATMVGNSSQEAELIKMHLKAAKTLLLVTGTFSLCWLPFVFNLINIFYTDRHNPYSPSRNIQQYFSILLFINCAINPIIYAIRLKGFRSEFSRILTCYQYQGAGSSGVTPIG